MLRLVENVHRIFSVYGARDGFSIAADYLRIVARNRLAHGNKGEERIASYRVSFPHRAQFFGMASEIFFRRLYREPNKRPLTIIDAGANIGLSTLYFKWRCPEATVLCFEPNPEVVPFLKENIARNNLSRVTVFPFALGKATGDAVLFTDASMAGSSSATTVTPLRSDESRQTSWKIPVRRLSGFIDTPIDLLKLDVEGAEGEVLEDLEQAGKLPLIRAMAVEYHLYDRRKEYPMGAFLSILDRNGLRYRCQPLFTDLARDPRKGVRTYMVYAER
ncbi:MAG: FkbM family methyltransferase [bacterium]|nr:FkbM family methyltransferase [bacterium]